MTTHQNIFFPITIQYNGQEAETKALKYAYSSHEVLYKVALPSIIATINQCWFSKIGSEWKLVMGQGIDKLLTLAIITAIEKYEQISSLYTETATGIKLKSA